MGSTSKTLPQLESDRIFLTDGGMETTLIFHENLELPDFASFDLLRTPEGTEALRKYYSTYAAMARDHRVGFILESATWRANPDWGRRLGYDSERLAEFNAKAIELLHELRDEFQTEDSPMVISGCIGPRGDGYDPKDKMTAEEAEEYHAEQIRALKIANVDLVAGITINYLEEAIGITKAAQALDLPAVISFTLETDGRLPTGQTIQEAIEKVDAATDAGPAYFMINCAHATHFEDTLQPGAEWTRRVRGIRPNASRLSHAELDECETLDDGNPEEFGRECRDLRALMGHINILGGCCGTDHRHLEAICSACLPEDAED